MANETGVLNGESTWNVKDNAGHSKSFANRPSLDDLRAFKSSVGYTKITYEYDDERRVVTVRPKDVSGKIYDGVIA